jgi:hypothetical protein
MRRSGLAAAALLAWPLLAGRAAEPGPLEARVRDSVAALRGLESLYRESEDPKEQAAALQNVLARAAWLEQAGGLKDARADALLALARWDLLGLPAPLQYGFLTEGAGAAQAEAVARRPRPSELPAALSRFENRLLYLQVRNTSRRPLALAGRPFVEVQRQLETSRLRVPAAAELPAELQPFAALFTWPERLAAGEVVQNLAWLPEDARVLAIGVDVREEDRGDARALRVVFLEAQDEEGLKRTRREAERQELAIREERRKRALDVAQPPSAARTGGGARATPPPEPPKVPAEKIPRALGVAERAGADEIIQVRLNEGETFASGEVLRVRKKNAWVGRVRMPEHQTPGAAGEKGKTVFWATIIQGYLEGLAGGTLHPEE